MKKVKLEIPTKLQEELELLNCKIELNRLNPSFSFLNRMNNTLILPSIQNLILVLVKAKIEDKIDIPLWIDIKEPKIKIDFIATRNGDREVILDL